MSETKTIFIPALEPQQKHPTAFQNFDALKENESFFIINDHDPKPLYYQLVAERGKGFSWRYIENGPQQWQVEIRKNEAGVTIGELVAADIRKAEVFRKWDLDFCCGGKKTIKQACAEKGLDAALIEAELNALNQTSAAEHSLDFNRWSLDFLADYIYQQHHQYYYEEGPVIADLLQKVALKHSKHFPELQTVVTLYEQLQQELNTHFLKEERVLFPFIKAVVKARRNGDFTALAAYPALSDPIQMMEADHDAAGEILAELSKATHHFAPPAGTCNSFRLLYKKLYDLQADLQQHIHLENNILFPKALGLEKELRN